MDLRRVLASIPIVGPVGRRLRRTISAVRFRSAKYWETRYLSGGTSGAGSYGRLAQFKAETLNRFVAQNEVQSVVEFGCGDGSQLALAEYPRYMGLDVAPTAVDMCRERFRGDDSKSFALVTEHPAGTIYDLAISLDVIYHLTEDRVFETYMSSLFDAAKRFVIIYSSNHEERPKAIHMRHRRFTDWVAQNRPDWRLEGVIQDTVAYDPRDEVNTSFSDFYIFCRCQSPAGAT